MSQEAKDASKRDGAAMVELTHYMNKCKLAALPYWGGGERGRERKEEKKRRKGARVGGREGEKKGGRKSHFQYLKKKKIQYISTYRGHT